MKKTHTHTIRISEGRVGMIMLLSVAIAALPGHSPLGRRALLQLGTTAAAGLSHPAIAAEERIVVPILGNVMSALGPGGFQLDVASAQLGLLAGSRAQCLTMIEDVSDDRYTSTEDETTVLMRASAVYLRPAPNIMSQLLTQNYMPLLNQSEQQTASALTADFEASLGIFEQALRDRDKSAQLVAIKQSEAQLARYLELASQHYKVPSVAQAPSALALP